MRIFYDDYRSDLKELLYYGNFTIHERNIGPQHLAVEAYLVKNGFILLLLETMFSNLAKVIIIFKHQIPKPYILAENLLRHYEQKYRRKILVPAEIKSSRSLFILNKDKELDSRELFLQFSQNLCFIN